MATYWAYVTYVYTTSVVSPWCTARTIWNHTHGKLTQQTDCVKINGVNGRNLGRLGPDNQAFVSATSSLDTPCGPGSHQHVREYATAQ